MMIIKRVVATIILAVVILLIPKNVFANTDMLVKNKTNKLELGDTVDEKLLGIEDLASAGKSITYTVNVPKGTLYIQAFDAVSFKIEIYDSKNKVIKKIESVNMFGLEDAHLARDGMALSKGKYKIKISPLSKENALNINGTVSMISNATSKTLDMDKTYNIAVTEGSTYKFKVKVKEYLIYEFDSSIVSYDPNDFIPFFQDFKILNSEGKTVSTYDEFNQKNQLN